MWFGVIATLENQRTSTIQSNWSGENILYTGTVLYKSRVEYSSDSFRTAQLSLHFTHILVLYQFVIAYKYSRLEMATAQRTRPRAVVGAPRRAAWQLKSALRHSVSAAPRTIIFSHFF